MQSSAYLFWCIAVVCVVHILSTWVTAFKFQTNTESIQNDVRTNDWPSLKLHFMIKRKSMRIHDDSEFIVFASPTVSRDGLSVKYDGYMDVSDGLNRTRYMLFDGIVYATTTSQTQATPRCVNPRTIPPFMDMLAALNDAVPVVKASLNGANIKCLSGTLLMTKLNGLDLAICASSSLGLHIYGSDMEIVITYLKDRVPVPTPPVEALNFKCDVAVNATAVSDMAIALLTGDRIPDTEMRVLNGFSLAITDTKCSCKSKPRPCLFIHGLGIDFEEEELQDSFDMYWGNMTDHAPCCTYFKYMIWNSMNTGWNNITQQQILCDLATNVTGSGSSSEIADTIIITHSMGGLMFAGAIANRRCAFANSSSWIALSAPMAGSMGSDYALEGCDGKHSVLMEMIGNVTGQCPVLASAKSLLYEGGKTVPLSLIADYKAAQQVYRTRVHAAVCSNSYSGLFSLYQPKYWLLGAALPHQSEKNDGMVEFQSCAGGFPLEKFGTHFKDQFYVSQLNHADTTFYYGDGLFNSAKMPVKWFECLL
ncbi:putative alpha/Beta hydrolase [Plasmopara halstedii]